MTIEEEELQAEDGHWMIVVLGVYLFNLNNPMGAHLELSPLETSISFWCRLSVYVHMFPARLMEKSCASLDKTFIRPPENGKLLVRNEPPEQTRSIRPGWC